MPRLSAVGIPGSAVRAHKGHHAGEDVKQQDCVFCKTGVLCTHATPLAPFPKHESASCGFDHPERKDLPWNTKPTKTALPT